MAPAPAGWHVLIGRQGSEEAANDTGTLFDTLFADRLRAYASPPMSARDALNTLKKVQSRLEVGINYQRYTEVVGEAWADVSIIVESPDGEQLWEFSALLKEAIRHYKSAVDTWQKKITSDSRTADLDDENRMQLEWHDANACITNAKQMLEPKTCLEAVRIFVKRFSNKYRMPFSGDPAYAAQEFSSLHRVLKDLLNALPNSDLLDE